MRKILLGIITILLLTFAIYITVQGTSIGNFKINSFTKIKEANEMLDKKISAATQLKETSYPQNIQILNETYKKVMTEKQNYEQVIALGVNDEGETINSGARYEMEKLWVTLGRYADKQGVDLKLEVIANTLTDSAAEQIVSDKGVTEIFKSYDLKFTLQGGYVQITDFLYDIEKDRSLVFKIENYKMVPGSSVENLMATFTCKDVYLNISSADAQQQTQPDTQGTTTDGKTTNDQITANPQNTTTEGINSTQNGATTNSNS